MEGNRQNTKPYDNPESKVERLQEPIGAYATAISFNPFEQAFLTQKGLPTSILKTIATKLKLSNVGLAELFDISEKTLRTRMKNVGTLKSYETDLALSLLEMVSEGIETFEDHDNFLAWLNTPWEAMGNQKPASFLKSVSGVKFLIDELRSIRHGVFA